MIVGLILLLAGLVQGITSFGFSMVAVPLLAFFLPMQDMVPMLILYSVVMNSMILWNLKGHLHPKKFVLLILAGIVTTRFGIYLLEVVPSDYLVGLASAIVMLMSLAMIFNYSHPIKNERLSFLVAGSISGLLNGSVSFSGPPIVLFMANQGYPKQVFRANLTFYFWTLNLVTILMMVVSKVITPDLAYDTVRYLPFLLVGVFAGIKIGNLVQEDLFKRGVMIILVILGLTNLIKLFV